MNKRAARTLITSKGTVRAGGDIPKGLSKDEMREIEEAGGIAHTIAKGRTAGQSVIEAPDDRRGDAFKAAVDRVKAAEADAEAAATDEGLSDEDRQSFEDALADARRDLYALS